jgi:hypothetical protein
MKIMVRDLPYVVVLRTHTAICIVVAFFFFLDIVRCPIKTDVRRRLVMWLDINISEEHAAFMFMVKILPRHYTASQPKRPRLGYLSQ